MIAAKLIEAREKKGYSQAGLANEAGVNRQMIYRLEKGAKPLRENLIKIAKALDVPIEYFLVEKIDGKNQVVKSIWKDFEQRLPSIRKFSTQELKLLVGVADQIIEKRKQVLKNYEV